eukprot:6212393-Pleurochrysis_carterae.AAC.5
MLFHTQTVTLPSSHVPSISGYYASTACAFLHLHAAAYASGGHKDYDVLTNHVALRPSICARDTD